MSRVVIPLFSIWDGKIEKETIHLTTNKSTAAEATTADPAKEWVFIMNYGSPMMIHNASSFVSFKSSSFDSLDCGPEICTILWMVHVWILQSGAESLDENWAENSIQHDQNLFGMMGELTSPLLSSFHVYFRPRWFGVYLCCFSRLIGNFLQTSGQVSCTWALTSNLVSVCSHGNKPADCYFCALDEDNCGVQAEHTHQVSRPLTVVPKFTVLFGQSRAYKKQISTYRIRRFRRFIVSTWYQLNRNKVVRFFVLRF